MCEIMERITADEIDKIHKLNAILLKNKRYDGLQRTTEDHEFQKELIRELLPKEIDS